MSADDASAMALRFPYAETRSETTGEVFYVPSVPVRIVAPGAGGSLAGPVLLDTGADRTHIPRNLAERLDIDLTGLPERTMIWGEDWETTVLDAPAARGRGASPLVGHRCPPRLAGCGAKPPRTHGVGVLRRRGGEDGQGGGG